MVINARTRVFGVLVAVVLAASVVTGFGATRGNPSPVADNTYAPHHALGTDAVLSSESLRGDKIEARRLLAERFALAASHVTNGGSAEPSFGIPARLVVPDASPAPGLSFGRAPPSYR